MTADNSTARIIPREIVEQMESKYLSYSMSVIVARALPDVRDGLKPVQRRILWGMWEHGNTADKPFRKSAKTVGDVLGRYHPHGDSAVYETMVRLAQDWVLRYPLVEGQGNFGSMDGDSAAAMRYTEARLSKIAGEMLSDIDKNTVDFVDNFDNTAKEPTVLPARFPNLLANGASGIAVGMATNIPPHNLGEIIDALHMMIDNPAVTVDELMFAVKGPDFPTGGIILGKDGIRKYLQTGSGTVTVRGRTVIESLPGGKSRIAITEIPYGVNKARLIERIAQLHREKKIDGITDLRDESTRDGVRVVIELRRDTDPNVILNQLFKHTPLQTAFSIKMLCLVDGRPRVLNLKQMLHHYLQHQVDVIVRRTRFDLDKAQSRVHIVEGLLKALEYIDQVIATIRHSETTDTARSRLIEQFGFTETQAQHILDMQLRRLTALERDKLVDEYAELQERIKYLNQVLADPDMQYRIIKDELSEIKQKYADQRRTQIVSADAELKAEDLIADEEVIITLSHTGYIKRMPLSTYRAQKRGGRGVVAAGTKEDDFIERLFTASTHDTILFITDTGRIFRKACHEIPEASRHARGTAIVNLLNLHPGEKVKTVIPIGKDVDPERNFLFFATRSGMAKRTALSEYTNIRQSGIIAIRLDEGDTLVSVNLTDGNSELIAVTSAGMALRFRETDIKVSGRDTKGVRVTKLPDGVTIVGMEKVNPDADLLVVTAKGVGKRTPLVEYPTYNRGARGVTTIKLDETRHGEIVGIAVAPEDGDVIMVSEQGILIRIPVKEIRRLGRATKGVTLMSLEADDRVAALAQIVPDED